MFLILKVFFLNYYYNGLRFRCLFVLLAGLSTSGPLSQHLSPYITGCYRNSVCGFKAGCIFLSCGILGNWLILLSQTSLSFIWSYCVSSAFLTHNISEKFQIILLQIPTIFNALQGLQSASSVKIEKITKHRQQNTILRSFTFVTLNKKNI